MTGVLRTGVRVLEQADTAEVLRLCDQDPVANVFVAGRVEALGASRRALGGELWGYGARGRLESLCWSGANLVPVQAGPEALEAFAARALRQGRRCSSLVGPADQVLPLWDALAGSWGSAREVRQRQPLMVLDGPPAVEPDPSVRRSDPADLDVLVPACVAMFTEEVGYSPVGWDGGATYRSRVAELVRAGRSFVRIDDIPAEDVVTGLGPAVEPDADRPPRRVAFKAELGAVSRSVAQVQGVFVDPALRGRGLAAPGMAAVAVLAQRQAPVVSLYVNDFNAPAVAAYRRAGFREVGSFATVLF